MTIRRIIDLIESTVEVNFAMTIAEEISSGVFEGFNPYWKLVADPRVLQDKAALDHISTLVMDGFTSGMHPTWELKIIDSNEDELAVDEDVLLPPHTPTVSGPDTNKQIDEEIIDIVHAHSVVPVAETHGLGKGWYEVPVEQATRFVVEDEEGHIIDHFDTFEEAKTKARELNRNMSPTDMKAFQPVEETIDDGTEGQDRESYSDTQDRDSYTVDDEDIPTRFDKAEDFVVIINAIHERGIRQQEALTELNRRGLWLSKEQKKQAGLE